MKVSLRVNGEQREADVWEGESLLYALRVLTKRALERTLA